MFQIGKTIVSEDIIEKDFLCNLNACKGACCVDGDAGAPLEPDEAKILNQGDDYIFFTVDPKDKDDRKYYKSLGFMKSEECWSEKI